MVTFNELRVDSASAKLIIDAAVKDLSYYTDVYIKAIYVHTLDTLNTTDPTSSSSTPIYTKDYTGTSTKSITLLIDGSDRTDGKTDKINMSATLFFVIIECEGTPSSETPCGMDNVYTIDATMDMCPIYNKILHYIKELGYHCHIPQGLIDTYLLFKGVQIAILTSHYQEAINYYKKFFIKNSSSVNTCSCYG